MTPLLAINDLHLELALSGGALPVLRGVSLRLDPGRVLGLVGESGAGKTMVGKAVLGIQPGRARISAGSIVFDGGEITHLAGEARRALLGRGMALIPQDPMSGLNPVRRVDAQMTDVLRLHLGLDRAAAAARAKELLDAVHIRHPARVLRLYPHELSGGMRQRVLIAIAFACRPRLIVADEPTTALDVTVQRQILRLIKELQSNFGTALLFISHDLGVVSKICDEVAVMYAGRVLEWAPVAGIFARPKRDYTRALFAATPRYDRPAEALKPVPNALTERLLAEAAAYDARRAASLGHA
jgi:peptide/nickel transport system ATP-binding protein